LQYVTEFTMWAVAASPIIVATNVLNMTDTMKKASGYERRLLTHWCSRMPSSFLPAHLTLPDIAPHLVPLRPT
jgi:hypothetical protein